MIIIYFFLGLLSSSIGAIPLGAVNLAVINTTLNENKKKSLPITISAGIGEITLVIFALLYSSKLSNFFIENKWIQILFILLFFTIGMYFITIKNNNQQSTKQQKNTAINKKLITGFSLAIINPPVIMYWILAISIMNSYFIELTTQTPTITLILFFSGIYTGKTGVLYLYSKWSFSIAQKSKNNKSDLSKLIGFTLIIISIFQSLNILITN